MFESVLTIALVLSLLGLTYLGIYGMVKKVAIEPRGFVLFLSTMLISITLLYSGVGLLLRSLLLAVALILIGVYVISTFRRSLP